MFLGNVPDKIYAFDIALRPIALSEIDQTRTLRAEDVQPKAQSLRLSIIVHERLDGPSASRKPSSASRCARRPLTGRKRFM